MCAQENLVVWSSPLVISSGQQSSGKKPRSEEDKWAQGSLICLVILWQTCEVDPLFFTGWPQRRQGQEVDGSSRTRPIFLPSIVSPTTGDSGRWNRKGKVVWLHLCRGRQAMWDPQLYNKCQFGDQSEMGGFPKKLSQPLPFPNDFFQGHLKNYF